MQLHKTMKNKETLKEVAERYVDSFEYSIAHPRRVAIKSFINGAKWQAERMYSEEESFENKSLKWWMSLSMDEQVEIGFKYDMPTFNLTLRAIMHEFEQFKNK